MLDYNDIQMIQAIVNGQGQAPAVPGQSPMAWMTSQRMSDPMAYTPSMITKDPNQFFGPIGGLIANHVGLVGRAYDGTMQPLLRTNLFDRPNPGVTGFEHAMMRQNAIMQGHVQDMGMSEIGKSFGSAFSPDSLLGRFAFETDDKGRYVHGQGMRNTMRFLQSAAGNPLVAGQLNGFVNDFLGYDRGASGDVYSARARMMVEASPGSHYGAPGSGAAFTRGPNGGLMFNPNARSPEEQARLERTLAGSLESATQRVLYNGGLTKDWSVSHGVSDKLIAQMMSEAGANGLLDDYSVMSDADRERRSQADQLQEQINDSAAAREELAARKEEAVASGDKKEAARLQRQIDFHTNDITALSGQKKEIESEITTHDGGGSLMDVAARNAELEKKKEEVQKRISGSGGGDTGQAGRVDELQQELAGLENSGKNDRATRKRKKSLAMELERARAELEKMESEIDNIAKEQEKISKGLDHSVKEMTKSLTGAIDAMKDFTGDEQSAKEMLDRLTGNKATREKGAAQRAEDEIRDLNAIAAKSNFSPMQAGQVLQRMMGVASGSLFGASAADTALVGNVTGHFATMGAKNALKASHGATTEEERKLAEAGAQYGIKEMMNSTGAKVTFQARSALENGTISQEEYDELIAGLQSTNEGDRKAAVDKFYRMAYESVEEGRRQRDSAAEMLHLVNDMTNEGRASVADVMKEMRRQDHADNKQQAKASRRLGRAERRAVAAGIDGRQMVEAKQSAGYDAAMDVLGKDPNNQQALDAKQAMQGEHDAAYKKAVKEGKSPEEAEKIARRAAVDLYKSAYKDQIGDVANEIEYETSERQAAALDAMTDRTALSSISGGLAEMLSGVKGITEKNGSISVGNLGEVGKVVMNAVGGMGPSTLEEAGLDRKTIVGINKNLAKARESGDAEEQQRILGEVWGKLTPGQRRSLQFKIGRSGIQTVEERKAREVKIEKSASERLAVANKESERLTGRGARSVEALQHFTQLDLETSDDNITPEDREKARKLREEESKRHRASGETFLDSVTGNDGTTIFDWLSNPDLPRGEKEQRLRELMANMGAATGSPVPGGGGGVPGAEAELAGGPPSVSGGTPAQVAGNMEQGDIIANILGSSDDQFRQYYGSIGGRTEHSSFHTDITDILDLKHRINKETDPEERAKLLKKLLSSLRGTHKDRGKEAKKTSENQNLDPDERDAATAENAMHHAGKDAIDRAMKALDSGEVVLDNDTVSRIKGGGGSGLNGAGGVGGSASMERLISAIGELISQLRTSGGFPHYGS